MDPGVYGQSQGAGYHSGVPLYLNQQSSFVHQPVFHAYPPRVPPPQVILTSHQAPAPDFYQRPPPMQPVTAQSAGPAIGVPVYPHVQNMPTPVQGQLLHYTGPPLQQYTAPTHQPNLAHPPNPMGQPLPPVEKSGAPVMSTIPWSAAISPPPSESFNFTQRSTTPPSSCPLTVIPARLKLLAEQYKQTPVSSCDKSNSSFLNAALQHGIVIGRPETPPSAEPSKSVTPPTSEPFPFLSLGNNIDGNRAIDRQNLVDYYVNKHESLSQHRMLDKDLNKVNEASLNENNNNNANDGSKCVSKSLEKYVWSEYNTLTNRMEVVKINAKPLASGDRNSNVLNWLSKSEGVPVSNDHYDFAEEVNEKESSPEVDHEKNLENVSCVNQAANAETEFKKLEDILDVNDNYFDDSVDIVIEEHEFLSYKVSSSPFGDENSSSEYDDDDETALDEVDGEIFSRSDLVKKEGEVVDTNADILSRTKEISIQMKGEEQVLGIETADDMDRKKLPSKEKVSLISQTDDEKIVNQYQQQLEEVEKAQIELLASASKDVEKIASNIVSQAIAKGVIKFFSTFKDKLTDTEKENYEKVLEIREVKNMCGNRNDKVSQESKKGLYSWNSGNEMNKDSEVEKCEDIVETDAPCIQELTIRPTSKKPDDFEKFFFKRTASKHGITIVSPEKVVSYKKSDFVKEETPESIESHNDEDPFEHLFKSSGNSAPKNFYSRDTDSERRNIKEAFKMGIKRVLSEEADSDVNSIEGSQSDFGDAFRLKASLSGILVQDPSEKVEFSTDSDAELEQLSRHRNSRGDNADTERKRSTSTPDPFNLPLNPKSPEFKPGWKKRTISGGLRPEAAEFNPESLNSSFSLNTSVSGSDFSEKLDSSMRIDAPAFVPVSIKTGPTPRYDAALFEPKEQEQRKPKVFYIPTPKEKTPNPSVAIQASLNTSTICVGTKKIKTKESAMVTNTCNTRDVSVNTETDTEIDGKNVNVKKSSKKFTSKATNTDMSQKRSIGINVRSKTAVKPLTYDMTTMTEVIPEIKEEGKDMGSKGTDLEEKLKKQAILLESMGSLQIELMLFKEKEIREKLSCMKEDLMKRMTGVMGLFTDGLKQHAESMIQSKLRLGGHGTSNGL
ncbi:uncharacterized protein LOC123535965 [Mercenaria mercenaria]|uniref:uncharacterized protein LOC123535965 n=1 Tax=Mercenaria mercenaria TaxID=6596 RepID=UPI00234F9AE2|nr:uncharacterized protein LOC123535965 [Mercenaria mercenaria]